MLPKISRLTKRDQPQQPTPMVKTVAVLHIAALTGVGIVVFVDVTVFAPLLEQQLP